LECVATFIYAEAEDPPTALLGVRGASFWGVCEEPNAHVAAEADGGFCLEDVFAVGISSQTLLKYRVDRVGEFFLGDVIPAVHPVRLDAAYKHGYCVCFAIHGRYTYFHETPTVMAIRVVAKGVLCGNGSHPVCDGGDGFSGVETLCVDLGRVTNENGGDKLKRELPKPPLGPSFRASFSKVDHGAIADGNLLVEISVVEAVPHDQLGEAFFNCVACFFCICDIHDDFHP